MAVTHVNELMGSGKRSSSQNHLWQRTYKRTFLVQTSTRFDGSGTARAAVDPDTGLAVPLVGNSYTNGTATFFHTEVDAGAFVQSVSAEENSEDGKAWLVTVEYGPYDASQFSDNPLDWPLRVSFGANRYEKILQKDEDGNAIVNSSGDPFSEPATIDDSRSLITTVRNELKSSFDFTLAETYRDSINAASWNGFDRQTVKCTSIVTGQEQYDSKAQVWYYEVTYVFEVNRNTWLSKPLDQGYTDYSLITGKRLTIHTTNGQPPNEPSLLDGDGHRLATGHDPVFLEFKVYPELDFSAFNIDLSTSLGMPP
jgi:hypothetical protein